MTQLDLAHEEKLLTIEKHFEGIMQALGCDLSDSSLAATPKRVAKMFVEELFAGMDPNAFPNISYIYEGFEKGGLIQIKEIAVHSICEHHFLPFTGTAEIAYLPNTKILGLSKFNRIVDYFCRRPQLQERLTMQIADCLSLLLGTEDIAIKIAASHGCVTLRGIHDPCSQTITRVYRGKFLSDLKNIL